MATIALSNYRALDDFEIYRIYLHGLTRLFFLGIQGIGKSSIRRQQNNIGIVESSTVDSEQVERADIIGFVVDFSETKLKENAG
ncbi:hypothetical protein ACFX2I_017780 [Malus domestica]